MGGLWPAYPAGTTDKPGSIDINGDLFLVPQRVYSVTGSLLDQVTYPLKIEEADCTDEIFERAQKLLDLGSIPGILPTRPVVNGKQTRSYTFDLVALRKHAG